LTVLATFSAMLVVAAFMAAKAARDALLLTQFTVESLPLFMGLSAALSLPAIVLFGKKMSRHGPQRLVPAVNALSAAACLVEWFLITWSPHKISAIVFFHLNIAGAVLVSGFWSIVNERYDVVTAKRHIGRIGMGATIGGILGGLIAERTAAYFAAHTILLVLAIMQGTCAVLLAILGHKVRIKETPQVESSWSALAGVVRSHLLRKAGLVVVITAIGAGALDYVFKSDIVHHGPHADLLGTLAIFYTVTNIITAVVQIVLCGPAIATLGVPRSVTTLPVTLTGFSLLALLFRAPMTATISRAAELISRNSIYRAGYELLYAPLPPEQKRPTKVVLDVGADKLGDIIAAQLVAAVVYLVADSRTGLIVLAVAAGAVSLMIGVGLRRSYTESLESSLLEKANELPDPIEPADPEPWLSLTTMPVSGDAVPLQMRRRRRPPVPKLPTETVVESIRELRSSQAKDVTTALNGPLAPEAIPAVIELVGSPVDKTAIAAATALRAVAPRYTGTLIDVLIDPARSDVLRRRMPAILVAGQPDLAIWGLWRALRDPSFEVRYRSSIALAALAGETPLPAIRPEEVFACVCEELKVDREAWKARKLSIDAVIDSGDAELDVGLAHVFRMLGLVLPAEPLRVALRAAKTEDPELRGMALEYLESILPPDVRAQLWPLLDATTHEAPEHPSEQRIKVLLDHLRKAS
jgi:ATP/ADP translocase